MENIEEGMIYTMRWTKEDMEKYKDAKEFVDTLLIPLAPFEIGDDATREKHSFQQEVLHIFAQEIEQLLAGRVILIPSYLYMKHANKDSEVERIKQFTDDVKKQPFEHVFYITFDASWRKYEKNMEGSLLWVPSIQTGDLKSKEVQALIRDQVNQLSELIRSDW